MIRLYSKGRVGKILRQSEEQIRFLESRYALPGAALRAVLYKELLAADILDPLADAAVSLYWLRFSRRKKHKKPLPAAGGGLWRKRDSSTGYAQVFGQTAIQSILFALEKGLDTPSSLGLPRPPDPEGDLPLVWKRLRRDRAFNLRMAALTLLSAAWELTGTMDFSRFSPEEMQLVFTRYNASAHRVTPYGREVYQYYLRFAGDKTGPEADAPAAAG